MFRFPIVARLGLPPRHVAYGVLALALAALLSAGCTPRRGLSAATLDAVAARYVVLVLQLGRIHADDVDSYFGPDSLKVAAMADSLAPAAITQVADSLRNALGERAPAEWDEMTRLRHGFLRRQLAAIAARARMLGGQALTFDEEALALYDMTAPPRPDSVYDAALARIEALLPGPGPLHARVEAFEKRLHVPASRVDTVMRAALAECQRRTRAQLELPADEAFKVEYVKDVPWGAYNWYQGGHQSLIQVNTTFPLHVDRFLDLACHEGYPGHHVYGVLFEEELVRKRGWVEFTVYPLRTPLGPIAEGTAVAALEVAFPADERAAFEKRVLYPLAGLDTSLHARNRELRAAMDSLSGWTIDNAREYLDGGRTREQALAAVVRYGLRPPEQADRTVRFAETYRSYVVNYGLGKKLVLEWLDARGGTADLPQRRWALYRELLGAPKLPHDLRAEIAAAGR